MAFRAANRGPDGILRLELAPSVDAGGSENLPGYCIEKRSGVCYRSNRRPKWKFLVTSYPDDIQNLDRLLDSEPGSTLLVRIRPVNPLDVLGMAANSDNWEGFIRGEDAAGFNLKEAFLQGQELRHLPRLACVAELGKVKLPIHRVLKSGKR